MQQSPKRGEQLGRFTVTVPINGISLDGDLVIPPAAKGIVVFAHGSGSSRFSTRNRFVAGVLNDHAIGTLLIDLLTHDEEIIDEQTLELRFNIPLLAQRLAKVGGWIMDQFENQIKLGYFGASTGGAAALIAAAENPTPVAAIVSRGGRPDLAADFLAKVRAPTLLIVGGLDDQVITWNREALAALNPQSKLEIVPAATHLFEEAGTLEQVAEKAALWFERYFS